MTPKELYGAGHALGAAEEPAADGHRDGSPRSVAFHAQWFRVAVDPGSGEIRILRSVHAADAGRVMNPMRCRGQVEGGVPRRSGPPSSRTCGPTSGARPPRPRSSATGSPVRRRARTGVRFAETSDAIGPLGAKSMSESPFNPVAPAFATPCGTRPASASPN